jgi:DNA topoisomerase-1
MILVVVESPGKIKTISKILGKGFDVGYSNGIIRDLPAGKDKPVDPKNPLAIEINNGFNPQYVITKPKEVKQLKASMSNADELYIATDLDREGEGIAQSLLDILKPKKYLRITFSSVTQKAILDAIKKGGPINKNLSDAQKGRRILDRLYGYLVSPVLIKNLGGALSAGRVQSPTTRLVVDREREIQEFFDKEDTSFYKVKGVFTFGSKEEISCTLYEAASVTALKGSSTGVAAIPLGKNIPEENVTAFLKNCMKSTFNVHSVEEKPTTRSPAPPFITSTLQQEASRKFGMRPMQTMQTAQKLYEAGLITYMRTDSVEISEEGHAAIKASIIENFGEEHYKYTQYKNKSANAQEAHEAIRPTDPTILSVENKVNDAYQAKLYSLISKRTLASQMKPAKLSLTTIQITIQYYLTNPKPNFYFFQSTIEKIVYAGFMKVYVEDVDDNGQQNDETIKGYKGPIPKVGSKADMKEIIATQDYLRPVGHFTEASLIGKMEKMEIGRPATLAALTSKIVEKGYVEIVDIPGVKKESNTFIINKESIEDKRINHTKGSIFIGKEAKRLRATPLGFSVVDFLVQYFPEIVDYKFTADMEDKLDDVVKGKANWKTVVGSYYNVLKKRLDDIKELKPQAQLNATLLGTDEDGVEIFSSKGRYGPFVKKTVDGKVITAKILPPLKFETITLEDAIALFKKPKYPIILGKFSGKDVELYKGKFGFYIKHDNQSYNLKPANQESEDPSSNEPTLDEAIQAINAKKAANLKTFSVEVGDKTYSATLIKGPHGMYLKVTQGKTSFNIGVKTDNPDDLPNILTAKMVQEQIQNYLQRGPKSFPNSKKTSAKSTRSAGSAGSKSARKPAVKKSSAKKSTAKKSGR